MDTKKTKAMYFEEMKDILTGLDIEAAQKDELIDFIDKQLETLEKRKASAAKRAAEKRAESDALTDAIYAKIGSDPITVDEIVVALDDAEVTRNKVTARLGKLVRNGHVTKSEIKVGSNKRMAYQLAVVD